MEDAGTVAVPAHGDLAAFRCVFNGVVEKVEHELNEKTFVRGERGVRSRFNLKLDLLSRDSGGGVFARGLDDISEIDGFKIQRDLAGVGAGKAEEATGEADHAVDLLVDADQRLTIGFGCPFSLERDLALAFDGG